MKTEFQFNGFEPEEMLQIEAEGVLDQVLSVAPFGAYVSAKLEKINELYFCEIDVYTRKGSFISNCSNEDPFKALQHVEEALMKKLNKWKANKFYTGATAIPIKRSQPLTN